MLTRADMETIIAVLAPVLAGNLAERLAPIEAELASLKAGAFEPADDGEADALAELGLAYDALNAQLFDGQLPDPRLVTHTHGEDWAHVRTYDHAISFHRLFLSLASREQKLAVLLHEMAHIDAPDDGHGSRWQATMRRCGLEPDPRQIKVIQGGQFQRFLNGR